MRLHKPRSCEPSQIYVTHYMDYKYYTLLYVVNQILLTSLKRIIIETNYSK